MNRTTEEEIVKSKLVRQAFPQDKTVGEKGEGLLILTKRISISVQISWGKSLLESEYLALDNLLCERHPLYLYTVLPWATSFPSVVNLKKGGCTSRPTDSEQSYLHLNKKEIKWTTPRKCTKRHGVVLSVFQLLHACLPICKSHRADHNRKQYQKHLQKIQKKTSCRRHIRQQQTTLLIEECVDRPDNVRGYRFSIEAKDSGGASALAISERDKSLELLQSHFSRQGCCWKHILNDTMPGLFSFKPTTTCSDPSAIADFRSNGPHTPKVKPPSVPPSPPTEYQRHEKPSLVSKPLTPLLHAHAYDQVINVARSIQPTSDLEHVQKHFAIGLAHYKLAQLDEAISNLTQGESIAQSAVLKGDVALFNVYLGDIKFSSEKFLDSVKCYKKAIDVYLPNNAASDFKMVPPSLSIIHAKCGSALRSASKSVEAIQHYKTAIDAALSDRDRLAAHTSLGNLYQSLGENTAALKEYEESIKLAKHLNDHISLGWAHGNMGNALLGLYRKDEALYHLQKALDIAVKHEHIPQAIGRTYNNLGTAYQSMNDLDKAEEHYDLALSQAIYGNDIPGQARVYGNIGNVLMLKKDYERAIRHFSEVLQLTKDSSTLSTALHNRGCAYYEWAEKEMELLCTTSSHDNACTASVTLTDTTAGKFCIHSSNNAANEYPPPSIPSKISKLYKKGSEDLEEVVRHHEETLEDIKGSSKGLSLSVSLFESNSRTFHRLQDCFVRQGKYDRALLVAEQSRTRTLGELMLRKHQWHFGKTLSPPLTFEQIKLIVEPQSSPVVYLSYTGARLLGWVFVPPSGHSDVSMSMFEVPLKDDMFDGKSFDYHVRYSLTEKLVENSFEMYESVSYDKESSSTVQYLHTLIAKPVKHILSKNGAQDPSQHPTSIVIIPDSYTSLVPFTCLLDPDSSSFLGDQYYFQLMPSLLSLGILSRIPDNTVTLPDSPHAFCIVGDPNIPPFHYNGVTWHLGKLPYARKEAEWVAHVLETTPVLHEQATRSTVLHRIMNAKVIHIATHGSASSGFLAFGTVAPHNSTADSKGVDAAGVLLYPEEVEKLSISPALVVLSSCDSGRGTVKADGIQGMARAFILAGAQSVLTTLWRVPDESASVFMKFFYRYLMDGMKSSMALHKAILSVRCFKKYSQYIHWSGYQLTGRDILFKVTPTLTDQTLKNRMGEKSVFPCLESLKKLKSALIDQQLPTDIPILRGSPGLRPSEVAKKFIYSSHEDFPGGIFWINCRHPDLIDASIAYIEKVTAMKIDQLPISEHQEALFVFDAVTELPDSKNLRKVMRNRHTHIIFTSKSTDSPDMLIKQVDKNLIRGCAIIEIEPLSMIESTQRIVHSVMKDHHLAPNNEDQKFFEKLAEFTSGSPVIVEVASKCLSSHFKDNDSDPHEILSQFSKAISLNLDRKSRLQPPHLARKANAGSPYLGRKKCRSIFNLELENILTKCKQESNGTLPISTPSPAVSGDHWDTNSQYDSWDSIKELIKTCKLTPEERLLLNTVCMFSCSPIPYSLVVEISSLIAMATQQPHIAGTLSYKLQEMLLMKKYPSPVILHSFLSTRQHKSQPEFVYIPQYISRSIWKNLDERDRVMALSTMFQALLILYEIANPLEVGFFLGLCGLLLEMLEFELKLMGEDCYKEAHQLCARYREKWLSYDKPGLPISDRESDSFTPHSREQDHQNQVLYQPKLTLDPSSNQKTEIKTLPISRPLSDIYPMTSKVHGVALIINNKSFDNQSSKLPGRLDHCEWNLIETFRFLGYRVEVQRQSTKSELDKLFDTIDPFISDADDSFMCCLLSPGGENVVYGSDHKALPLTLKRNSLEEKLSKCKKLNRKPKLIFAPFCRKLRCQPDHSDNEDIAFFYPPHTDTGDQDDFSPAAHNDSIIKFYIDTLCRLLCQNAPSRTLSEIHEEVTRKVTETSGVIDSVCNELTRGVFFFGNL